MNKNLFPFFRDLSDSEFEDMSACLNMHKKIYQKNDFIYRAGETVCNIGLVIRGSVNIENIDLWGNCSILSNISAGQAFAETYALCNEPMMVDAVAADNCEVLFFGAEKLMNGSLVDKPWHPKMMKNMLSVSLRKNIALSERIFCTASKTVRGRLLTYLSAQSVKQGSDEFSIPFDRQQMADYLNVDRSALSKELSKMRNDGMIEFRKNKFKIKSLDE